jgi:hypothetical protein
MSDLKLSGKLGRGKVKLGKLPPIVEPLNESDNEGSLRGMERTFKSVPDLSSGGDVLWEGREERVASRERRADPFHDFLHGSPVKMPSHSKGGEPENNGFDIKKVTKATIAEELRRLRQDDRVFKEGFRDLRTKGKHEGFLSGGVSLLQGDVDAKTALSRSKGCVKLPSLPTANQELQKLQELMRKQHRDLGFIKEEEPEHHKEFRSAFRSFLK